MTETPTFDIAIIGAGPGGLCAAHGLANLGFSVAVFERARALRLIGAAIGVAKPGIRHWVSSMPISLPKFVP